VLTAIACWGEPGARGAASPNLPASAAFPLDSSEPIRCSLRRDRRRRSHPTESGARSLAAGQRRAPGSGADQLVAHLAPKQELFHLVKTHKGELSFALRDLGAAAVDGRGCRQGLNPASNEKLITAARGALGARPVSGSTSGAGQARRRRRPAAGDRSIRRSTFTPKSCAASAERLVALGSSTWQGTCWSIRARSTRTHAPGLRAAARRVGGVSCAGQPGSLDRTRSRCMSFRPKPASLRASSSSRPLRFGAGRGAHRKARSATTSGSRSGRTVFCSARGRRRHSRG